VVGGAASLAEAVEPGPGILYGVGPKAAPFGGFLVSFAAWFVCLRFAMVVAVEASGHSLGPLRAAVVDGVAACLAVTAASYNAGYAAVLLQGQSPGDALQQAREQGRPTAFLIANFGVTAATAGLFRRVRSGFVAAGATVVAVTCTNSAAFFLLGRWAVANHLWGFSTPTEVLSKPSPILALADWLITPLAFALVHLFMSREATVVVWDPPQGSGPHSRDNGQESGN